MRRAEVHQFGHPRYEMPERGSLMIEGCPEDIDDLLRRASFTEAHPGVFTKALSVRDAQKSHNVLTVTIRGDAPPRMEIEASNVVGIVSLTPGTTMQINPKIPWRSIFEMVLVTIDPARTVEYQGMPLQDFGAEQIALDQIYVILAINYLAGLETIMRYGYVRDLRIERTDNFDGHGEIDVEQTLMNHVRGDIEPHWVRNRVDYDHEVNSLLHFAGKVLIRLFQQRPHARTAGQYDHIFSQVHREVDRLGAMGVTSALEEVDRYTRLSLDELPKQRRYYERAFDVSQAIVTSSLGQQLREGPRELVTDFVLHMPSLFERYTQVSLSTALDQIKQYDYTQAIESVTIDRTPTVSPFTDEPAIYHQPDHVMYAGDDPVGVIDSKYYAEGHDPVKEAPTRSRMLTYAYLLDVRWLAFAGPLFEPSQRTIEQTDATLSVIAPSGPFTPQGYSRALESHIHDILVDEQPILEVFRAVSDHALSMDGVAESQLKHVYETNGPFSISNPRNFSLLVVKAAANEHSREVMTRAELEQGGDWTRDSIETACSDHNPDATTCVPVFRRSGGTEYVDLYFIARSGEITRSQHKLL